MIITNLRYALVGYFITSYPTRAHGIIVIYSSIFKTARVAKKDWKDNKDNSRHLGWKYARIFVLGHYLFLVAHSLPRASLSENCSLLGTDNVRGQISEHIFEPNGDYYLFITHPLIFEWFYWPLYVTWCKSPDSYHAIIPVRVDICRLIVFVERET